MNGFNRPQKVTNMTNINDGYHRYKASSAGGLHPKPERAEVHLECGKICSITQSMTLPDGWMFWTKSWIHFGLTLDQATIPPPPFPTPPPCIYSQIPLGPAVLLNSLFITHSSRLMSSRDLTEWFVRAPRPLGSCSAAAEVNDWCQV